MSGQAMASQPGYTIIEVMIFLAITGILFLGAIVAIGGQQQKTQFSQGVRDLDGKLQDVINQVGSGFFPNSNTYNCKVNSPANPASAPTFSNTASESGTNVDCVFIGKVVQFQVKNSGQIDTNIFTIVGRRVDTAGKEVQDLSVANPRAVAADTSSPPTAPDITETYPLKWGVRVVKIVNMSNVPQSLSAVGFISTFGKYNALGSPVSGASAVNLSAVPLAPNLSKAEAATYINGNLGTVGLQTPAGGIVLCLQNGNSKAQLLIGGAGRQLNTLVSFDQDKANGNCP